MLALRAKIHKMLARIANKEDPIRLLLQKQSDLSLPCLYRPFWQASSVQNFRTFTVHNKQVVSSTMKVLVYIDLHCTTVLFCNAVYLLNITTS